MTELAEPRLSLALNLDRRQRAMLKEMGVQVWQPLLPVAPVAAVAVVALVAETVTAPVTVHPPVAPPVTINSGAARARIQGATGTFDTLKQPFQASKPASEAESATSAWRIGKLQTLYAESALGTGARWLILIESPASALQEAFNPFEGDAGKLLDNMLRAAKLHTAGAAMLAPLVRGQGTGGDLSAELIDMFASAKADVLLVMGRLAAQALLQSTEPLAKLRAQVHKLASVQTVIKLIVTLDPAYLLRNPLDKAKAWDDLCLGLSVAQPESAQ